MCQNVEIIYTMVGRYLYAFSHKALTAGLDIMVNLTDTPR